MLKTSSTFSKLRALDRQTTNSLNHDPLIVQKDIACGIGSSVLGLLES